MQLVADHRPLEREVEIAFRRASEEVRGEAARNAPVSVSRGLKLNAGNVQGGLRASLAVSEVHHDGQGWHSRVGSALRYAMQREYGGVILPVRKKLLSWIDPITGVRRFARRVNQRPGGPRQGYKPWLRPAGDRFPEFMDDHLTALG